MDPGTKMGPRRLKNKSSQNRFKTDMCVDLMVTNPTQLERAQTDTIYEIYRNLFVFPNMQNFDVCAFYTIHTMMTW
jgi:hypothetical protein